MNSLPFRLPPRALRVELPWLQRLTLEGFICTEVVQPHENSVPFPAATVEATRQQHGVCLLRIHGTEDSR